MTSSTQARARSSALLFLALSACGGDRGGLALSPPPPAHTNEPPTVPVPSGSIAVDAPVAPSTQPAIPKDANIVVISIDSVRADRLLSHGYAEDVMPFVNAFEKTAISYSRFYSISSYTSQSVGGFLAGRYPSELKRNGNFFGIYPEDETFFPEGLQAAGVRTMSAQAHFYFKKEKAGFHQGFDVWEILPNLKQTNLGDQSISSPEHAEAAIRQLSDTANTSGRFFAWYHLMDPHDTYQPHPEKSFGKRASQLYDGELYFTDGYVKKIVDFIDAQPWAPRTVVVLTSDHGEAFHEHDLKRHGFELYEILTAVPLLVRVPGVSPRAISEPRSMIDLAPTFFEVFGVPRDPAFEGTSLVSEWLGGPTPPRDVITDLSRNTDNDRRRTLLHGDYKIIELGDGDGYQLFNLRDDPGEERDRSRKEKEKLAEMKDLLKAAAQNIKEICPSRTSGLVHKKAGKPC